MPRVRLTFSAQLGAKIKQHPPQRTCSTTMRTQPKETLAQGLPRSGHPKSRALPSTRPSACQTPTPPHPSLDDLPETASQQSGPCAAHRFALDVQTDDGRSEGGAVGHLPPNRRPAQAPPKQRRIPTAIRSEQNGGQHFPNQ